MDNDKEGLMARRQLYLDIDGVLLRSRSTQWPFNTGWEPAPHCQDFLAWAVATHDCHWLTTRDADGGHEGILRAFRLAMDAPNLPPPLATLIRQVLPTRWNACKSSVLPFGSDFLWLDDNPSSIDLLQLDQHGCRDRWIEVNTDLFPEDLLRVMATLAA